MATGLLTPTQTRKVKKYRVAHTLGGKTEIVLSLEGGVESKIELADAHEASLVLGLLGSTHAVHFEEATGHLVVEVAESPIAAVVHLSPPPSVEQWLNDHHSVRAAIVWETSSGAQAYKDWPQTRKDDLQSAFALAWNYDSVGLTDPPPNTLHPADDEAPTTVLSKDDARWLYLASVGQSLAIEIGGRVSWSVTGYSSANLAILFDSRQFFTWKASSNGYQIEDMQGGYVVPAAPYTMYTFMGQNALIGEHRHGTIVRTLKWCHDNMSHNLGGHTAETYEGVWQYRGEAPVLRTINGTKDQAYPEMGVRHWTAGCHGTAGFLRAVLRTVNIPVIHDHQAGHALPYFSVDDLHLSHGDDPYSSYTVTDPQYSMSELLIDKAKYDSWFGSGVSDDQKEKNVSKRVQQLALEYLPSAMLRDYCRDMFEGKSHADGAVKANMNAYTVAQLEAKDLWTKMDAKIASLGGCDHIPS